MGYKLNSIVSRPYDTTLEENSSMYDKLPYKRDAELCNASALGLNSGNLVKYYRCATQNESREIETRDACIDTIISNHLKKEEKDFYNLHTHYPTLFGPIASENDEFTGENPENYDEENEAVDFDE